MKVAVPSDSWPLLGKLWPGIIEHLNSFLMICDSFSLLTSLGM